MSRIAAVLMTPLICEPASSETAPPFPALSKFCAATESFAVGESVTLPPAIKLMTPPRSPDASTLPVTVMEPVSAETLKR